MDSLFLILILIFEQQKMTSELIAKVRQK